MRFFLQDTFGHILRHVQEHYERLRIVKPAYLESGFLPMWKLLRETVNPQKTKKSSDKKESSDKKASSPMAGALIRAILSGGAYPVSLLEQTMLRIRAEQPSLTAGRRF